MNFDLKTFRKNQLLAFVFGLVFCGGIALLFGSQLILVSLGTFLFLVIGFKLSENFIALVTGLRQPGVPELFAVVAKLLWFALIFYFAKKPVFGPSTPVAIGMGSFLVSISVLGLAQYGIKKGSEPLKTPSNP